RRVGPRGAHARALPPDVESLVADGGEAPAHDLGTRARELEHELAQLVEQTRDFLRDEVVPGVEQMATDVHEACQALRDALADESAQALQAAADARQGRGGAE